jgi:hypothetical protein
MRILTACLAIALLAACNRPVDQTAVAEAPAPERVPISAGWTTTEGIATPESVFVDNASGFIYVSQIDGTPDGKDGNGRIVKLRGDGSVVDANWATGLNAPKGLRACGGSLWVADVGEVMGFDLANGQMRWHVVIPDAGFLNDVECAPDGSVFVSDMMGNKIWAVNGTAAVVWAEGEQLEWPNGLLVDGGRLIVGAWGRPEADFTTKVPGRLFALDLKTREKTLITQQPFANIDGVESDGRGGFIITDYLAGKVLRVAADGQVRELRVFPAGTADHAFVTGANIAIIPHMNENKVAAYALTLD